MRRLMFLVFMWVFLPSALSGGAGADQAVPLKDRKLIQVALLIDKVDVFWSHFIRIMNVAAAQLKFHVTVHHGGESHLAMIQIAKELSTGNAKPDVIMFKSFKGNGRHIMQIAARHGVKSFSINAPMDISPAEAQNAPSLIGQLLPNDEQAGYEQVKALRAAMLGKNRRHVSLIAVNGDLADSPARLRAAGLKRAALEFKDVTLLQLVSDTWTAPDAADKFALLRIRYPEANAIWAGNDTIALRIAERAKAMGLKLGEDLFIGGIDISPEGLDAVKRGDLVTSVGGDILDGGRALVILYDHFNCNKQKEKLWYTPMLPVTSSQVDRYLRILDPGKPTPIDFRKYSRCLHPRSSYDFSFPE